MVNLLVIFSNSLSCKEKNKNKNNEKNFDGGGKMA